MDLSYAVSVEFSFHDSFTTSSYLSSYTTGDHIKGVVSVISTCDVRFDEIQMGFIGEQSTQARLAVPKSAHHEFLHVVQSVEEPVLPSPRTLSKDQRYAFEFAFEVVDILPPSSCLHQSAPAHVRAAHLQLPPSLGDATTAGFGGKLRDDFAPATCQICYSIQLRINRVNPLSGARETLFTKRRRLRIKPAVDHSRFPQQVGCPSWSEYCMRVEKAVYGRRGKTPAGHLSIIVQEPVRIWLPSRDPHILICQAIQLGLSYLPFDRQHDATNLPGLNSFESKIRATTFYTTRTNDGCSWLERKEFLGQPTNFYDKNFPPFHCQVSRVSWTRAESGAYTATLQVPVTLPRENFLPTFYSCLISRVYTLKLKLNVQGAGSTKLTLPMIISAKRDPEALPSYDASVLWHGRC
ncbi:hypothetical protein BDW72DRAFT_192650 [Aspergillus terricola var. indicus]